MTALPDYRTPLTAAEYAALPEDTDHRYELQEVDVDLESAPPSRPGTVRVPDLVVVQQSAFDRVRRERTLLRAGEVVLAVEFLSPGSTRIDTPVKHHEYAEAGIGHCWIVDLDDARPGTRERP